MKVAEALFGSGKGGVKSKKGLAIMKAAEAADPKIGSGAKWLATVRAEPELLLEYKPKDATVVVDNPGGRYFLSFPGKGRKSLS